MKMLYRGRHAATTSDDSAPTDEPTRVIETAEAIDTTVTTAPASVAGGSEHNPKVSHPARP